MTYDAYPEERYHKRVTLLNVEDAHNLTEWDVHKRLMGMGACEWETYMSRLFVNAVSSAKEKGESTADITKMFSCDLVGVDEHGEYRKKQEAVVKFLKEKLFKVNSDTEEELQVTLKKA